MLRVINFEDSPTADPSSDNIKFHNSSGLPILELETPFNKERLCKYCRYGDSALNHLVWVCCCDGYNRFAHESCLKTAIFASIKTAASQQVDGDNDSWRRCSQCCVNYRLEFNKRCRLSCQKFKYNLYENTTHVMLSAIVFLLVMAGLIMLCLSVTKILVTLPEYTPPVILGLSVGVALQAVLICVLFFVFVRAHFMLPALTVSHIHGIDQCVPDQQLGLENENLIMLDLNGENKLVLLK